MKSTCLGIRAAFLCGNTPKAATSMKMIRRYIDASALAFCADAVYLSNHTASAVGAFTNAPYEANS